MYRYCSNNYMKSSRLVEICDWCQSEQKSPSCSTTSSSKAISRDVGSIIITSKPSEYSGDSTTSPTKVHGGSDQMRKNIISGAPSPRTAARRYKLLKDVKCWNKWYGLCVVEEGLVITQSHTDTHTYIYIFMRETIYCLSSILVCYAQGPIKEFLYG